MTVKRGLFSTVLTPASSPYGRLPVRSRGHAQIWKGSSASPHPRTVLHGSDRRFAALPSQYLLPLKRARRGRCVGCRPVEDERESIERGEQGP